MKVVFCVPGRSFSSRFLQSWTRLMAACTGAGIDVALSNKYSSVVHFARAMCLGADLIKGEEQTPWQGEVDYDAMVWIDSDIVFNPEQVMALLQSPNDITCGMYIMEDNKHYAVVKEWNLDFFRKHAHFPFLTEEDIKKLKEDGTVTETNPYVEVDYAGMGFMVIKKGVVEKLKYPWFYRPLERIQMENGEEWIDMCSEDTAFCHNLKDAGFRVMLDTRIRVGHEKSVVL